MARLLNRKLQKVMVTSLRQAHAAVKLQSWVRMWLVRKRYLHLLNTVQKLRDSRNPYVCKGLKTIQGSYELIGNELKLQVDIFLESQICRISDCIPFPIKN